MSTILIGVDASERSEDAVAFARRLADVVGRAPRPRERLSLLGPPEPRLQRRRTARRCATSRSRPCKRCASGSRGFPSSGPRQDHREPVAGARAAQDGGRRGRRADRRRLDPYRPRRPRAARQHGRAPAPWLALRGRRRARRAIASRRRADPPDRRRLQRDRRRRARPSFAAAELAGRSARSSWSSGSPTPSGFEAPALMGGPSVASVASRHRPPRPGEPRRARRRTARRRHGDHEAPDRRSGRPARRPQRLSRPARHRLARLRAAALRARGRCQRPRAAQRAVPGHHRAARRRCGARRPVRRRDDDGGGLTCPPPSSPPTTHTPRTALRSSSRSPPPQLTGAPVIAVAVYPWGLSEGWSDPYPEPDTDARMDEAMHAHP